LVRLKAEVVLAGVAQPDLPDLDRAAGVAPSDVAATHDSVLTHVHRVTFTDGGVRLLPGASAVRQADLVGVGVVSERPAAFCGHSEPHDPRHRVT